jgi:tetrapyrrole methylase family protein/MazG family protein
MADSNRAGITIVGLGPGDPGQLTLEAWRWLESAGEVYLRTRQHPTVPGLPPGLRIESFDDVYEGSERFEDVYATIIERVLALGRRPQGVTYAVPGHPFVAESTAPEIVRRAKAEGLPVRLIEGVSFLEPTFSALCIDPFPNLMLLDALEIGRQHTPGFAADRPALIAQIYSRQTASELKLTLTTVYPDEHPVRLVHAAGTAAQVVEDLALYEIDRSPHLGLLTALYLPALGEGTTLEAFQEVVARLRAPDGCPWDREQTHLSLRQYLLQETYEAIEALDAEDPDSLREELGDLLLQILLHAQIAYEEGEFTLAEVIQGIYNKIIRRHPHVFGDVQVGGVDGVLVNWEKLKEAERKEKGIEAEKGLLDGVPLALPALNQSQEIQDRAARVGFDWATIEPVWDKVREELQEVQDAPSADERAKELGDLLFAVVNLARWYKVDSETALRETNARFRRRFRHIEQVARQRGLELRSMTLAQMDEIWEAAKDLETSEDE